jgi:hypothetical protein
LRDRQDSAFGVRLAGQARIFDSRRSLYCHWSDHGEQLPDILREWDNRNPSGTRNALFGDPATRRAAGLPPVSGVTRYLRGTCEGSILRIVTTYETENWI